MWLLAGRSLALPLLTRRGRAPGTTWTSQVGYGATFALASLSCTVAPFLAVTAGALRSGGVTVVATYVAYAIGMGAVVGALSLAAATASSGVTARLRRSAPVIARISGGLLVLAGTYVAWYGWFELRVLAGATTGDPVVDAAGAVQSALARSVAQGGPLVIGVVALALTLVLATAAAVQRHRQKTDTAQVPAARS